MANLKEVRIRIASVNSTQQITKAMKMVSAAKLKRATDAIVQMRPYANKLKDILANLTASLEGNESPYTQQREIKNVLLVVVTSNRGLAGAFNANVIKAANLLVANKYDAQKRDGNLQIIAIGKKAQDYFTRNKFNVIGNNNEVFNHLNFDEANKIAEEVMSGFVAGKWDKVEVVYNQFKNAATQEIMTEQFLPIEPLEGDTNANLDYIFEPSKEEIVETLIPKSLKTQLYKSIRDSFASEHGARMTAMHKATDNATELRDQLKLTYNKARQASITNEILEIVGGAEALNG